MVNPSSIAGVHAYFRCVALALAGLGYAFFQLRLKLPRRKLLKRLILATGFLLWAVDQVLPAGRLTVFLGDAAIAAFVLNLFWIIQRQT